MHSLPVEYRKMLWRAYHLIFNVCLSTCFFANRKLFFFMGVFVFNLRNTNKSCLRRCFIFLRFRVIKLTKIPRPHDFRFCTKFFVFQNYLFKTLLALVFSTVLWYFGVDILLKFEENCICKFSNLQIEKLCSYWTMSKKPLTQLTYTHLR